MHTDPTSGSFAGAAIQQGTESERRKERLWPLPTPEVGVCVGLYAIAVSAVSERWLPGARIEWVGIWLFPYCWMALAARHARSAGVILDTRTGRGRRMAESVAWRTLPTAVVLSTSLLIPFALLGSATASLSWWQQVLVWAAIGLFVGLLGRLWRAARSRPSA